MFVRNTPRCLECGDQISYGRTDKKFCSEECKNRHHNHRHNATRKVKRKVMAVLEKNHCILSDLLASGVDSMWLADVVAMGFNPGYVTSFCRVGRHCRYTCFDISYIMTASRISSISKIQNLSLNLQAGPECGPGL